MNEQKAKIKNVTEVEYIVGAIDSDGSRRDSHTAAATNTDTWYLGETATVMDAEMLGIAMGWS